MQSKPITRQQHFRLVQTETNCRQHFDPLPDDKILGRSKLKQFADDNFKFHENSRKFSKRVENIVGKGEIALRSNFSFPTVFSKGLFPRGVKRCHCVGMG